jgi:glutathione S-transferase
MTPVAAVTIFLAVLSPFAVWYLWERGKRYTELMPGGLHEDVTLPYEAEFELYHNALSLCSKKMRICLDELAIPYEGHHIDLIETGSYENIGADYLAVNPGGILPVLVHNGHPVYESHDQIRYAAANAPEGSPQLVPADPELEKEMHRWVDKASLLGDNPLETARESAGGAAPGLTVPLFAAMIDKISYRSIFEGLLFHRMRERPMVFIVLKTVGLERLHKIKPVMRVVQSCLKYMHRHLDELEEHLTTTEGPWLLGETYSLADVSWIVLFERLRETDYDHVFWGNGKRPLLEAYWQRLRERPSYVRAITAHNHSTIDRGLTRLRETKQRLPALRQALEEN